MSLERVLSKKDNYLGFKDQSHTTTSFVRYNTFVCLFVYVSVSLLHIVSYLQSEGFGLFASLHCFELLKEDVAWFMFFPGFTM